MDSVYCSHEWVSAAALLEDGGSAERAVWSGCKGIRLVHPFVNRPIGKSGYRDIVSAFDFGGFFGLAAADLFMGDNFVEYCQRQGIVSEFVRFYPWTVPPAVYHPVKVRDNVIVDLTKSLTTIWAEAHPNARGPAKQAEKAGLRAERCPIEDFLLLYHKNVIELKRDPYYLFSHAWAKAVEPMTECWGAYTPGGDLIGAHLYVKDTAPRRLFYFLSASDLAQRKLRPNDFLFWQTIQRAKAEGYLVFHLGGGETESLQQFKAKWSPDRIPYYIGKRIYLPDVYQRLSAGRQTNFFPAYRER